MSDRPPIEGRVARILNLRELAINRGTLDGVTIGMFFDVLDPKAEGITDPETGEPLGSVYRPKVQVKVFAVEDRLSLARTFRSTRVNLGGQGGLGNFSKMLQPPNWVERHETLKTTESTWQDLDESESIVKTGDPVVEAQVSEVTGDTPGARTLEHPASERDLEARFAGWLGQQGWSAQTEVPVGSHRFDVVATRDDQKLVAEIKTRRDPLSVADVAQAIGWLTLFPTAGEGTHRLALVVGSSGVSADATEMIRARSDILDVFRWNEDNDEFEDLTKLKALPAAGEPAAE